MKFLAQTNTVPGTFGTIDPPQEIKNIAGGKGGDAAINFILGKSIDFIFTIAAVSFVIMFFISVVQMILSGGDKETLAKARARMNWAIIGVALLALSFAIFRILGDITGFKILQF